MASLFHNRPGWLGARPGWSENKSRMVREQVQNGRGLGLDSWRPRSELFWARLRRLENKSRMVGKLGQGPAECSIS